VTCPRLEMHLRLRRASIPRRPAVIEALACGCPVLVTASGGPEHLVDSGNGVVIPPRDLTLLREALLRMRHEADRYDRAAIRASALRLYGPEAFARGFAEILR